MRRIFPLFFLFLTACGYRFHESDQFVGRPTITVPYVAGDIDGKFTDDLIRQLAASGAFEPVHSGGNLELKVAIIENSQSQIGFRYDRNINDGKRKANLMPVENRRVVVADVTLVDGLTNEAIFGPKKVKGEADFDYINYDAPRDLAFFQEHRRIISFSLGQLDAVDAASDASLNPAFRQLAQKIVDGIIDYVPNREY